MCANVISWWLIQKSSNENLFLHINLYKRVHGKKIQKYTPQKEIIAVIYVYLGKSVKSIINNWLTVRMSDAEQKLDLISLFSSCFLLLPAPFKVVPVPGSAGLLKHTSKWRICHKRSLKSKCGPAMVAGQPRGRSGRNWANNETVIQVKNNHHLSSDWHSHVYLKSSQYLCSSAEMLLRFTPIQH